MSALLRRLAELAGIETSFVDDWGESVELSPERLRDLLEALGVPAKSEKEIRTAIDDLEKRPWRRLLPPVVVRREDEAIEIPLVVPEAAAALRWRVEEEGGRSRNGRIDLEELEEVAANELDGRKLVRRVLALPASLPRGYHGLLVELEEGVVLPGGEASLVVVPSTCYLPSALEGEGRTWGFAAQLYAVRSKRSWGMGDLTDALGLVDGAKELGAGILGVNPLHAPFLARPERASPYAASSRLFLNPLYLDVEGVADFAECEDARERVKSVRFQERLRQLRDAPLVEHAEVARAKLEILELLYRSFVANHLGDGEPPISERGEAFRRFQRDRGPALRDYALFEALAAELGAELSWEEWPEEYRAPSASGTRRFEREKHERVELYEYLQWLTEVQLGEAVSRCEELGLAVGLYLDLAVGVAKDGADVWADHEAYVSRATLGVPPDVWNPMGQDWSLPPLHPEVLRERGYAPFAAVLRASMRHASALRIDHVLALMRLYWIPSGKSPGEGGYVRYPFEDLLGIVALESRRNRCLVIGEDLGTVPEELRERLQRVGALSYRLFYFGMDDEGERFLPPEAYPRLALASLTTHDLPTLPGYWSAHDLSLRGKLGLFPSRRLERDAYEKRERDRRALVEALAREGLWEDAEGELPELDAELVNAVYLYLARTPAKILMVRFEDVLGVKDQANLPSTIDEHPNWRRKLPLPLSELLGDPRVRDLARRLREARPYQSP